MFFQVTKKTAQELRKIGNNPGNCNNRLKGITMTAKEQISFCKLFFNKFRNFASS